MTGTEDVVRRAKAYEAAGVDALFFAGGVTREQLDAIHSAVKLPLMMGGGRDGLDTRVSGEPARARRAARASAVLGRGAGGLQHAEGAARGDAAAAICKGIASAETMQRVTRERRLQELDGEVPGGLTGPLPASPAARGLLVSSPVPSRSRCAAARRRDRRAGSRRTDRSRHGGYHRCCRRCAA